MGRSCRNNAEANAIGYNSGLGERMGLTGMGSSYAQYHRRSARSRSRSRSNMSNGYTTPRMSPLLAPPLPGNVFDPSMAEHHNSMYPNVFGFDPAMEDVGMSEPMSYTENAFSRNVDPTARFMLSSMPGGQSPDLQLRRIEIPSRLTTTWAFSLLHLLISCK